MRTIHDIVPPSRRRETEPLTSESDERKPLRLSERPPQFPYKTLFATLLVIGVSVGALFYFSTTKVEIVPNTVGVAVQNTFTATQGAGSLPYTLITVQKIASQSIASTGTKTVDSFASGSITVYNTQSKSQRLVKNTRFMTTSGLIFRIHKEITVPAGNTTNPGTIEATVYADKTGDSYNIDPTSFTIPGLAGTPVESLVYARSSTSMTGGASGLVPVLDPVLESKTTSALTTALSPELMSSLQSKVPSGYILLPGAATTTFQELAPVPSPTTGLVEVKEEGTITAAIFPNAALAKTIAQSITQLNYQGEPLVLLPASTLTFSSTNTPFDANATSLSFTLTGTASLAYTIDQTRIAAAVAGKTRTATEAILTNFTEVKRAIITLRPFWRQTFPQDPSAITIVVDTP